LTEQFVRLGKLSKSKRQIDQVIKNNQTLLQTITFKEWFKKRFSRNAHLHYSQTNSEVKNDKIIDEMFARLDSDGGGTLDMGEITAIFKTNGVPMTMEQVADMFGEANRMELVERYRKMVISGAGYKMSKDQLKPKPTSVNV
jgi:hypothetical protein